MDEFYTINQAAISLKVHPLTVRRYIREGKLRAYRAGGNIRISVNDLRSFTQSFLPSRQRQHKTPDSNQPTKEFSFADPIFSVKGKGLNINKLSEE